MRRGDVSVPEMEGGEMPCLPEDCISQILSLTSPRDCCRSAAVSPTFRSAADSDAVWDRFLPSDLSDLLSRAVGTVDFASKKDLYFRLCDGVLVDGARMIFSLERSTGRRCYTLSAREIKIVWGDTPRYWTWGPHQDSRFPEVAKLLIVCWLEICGKLNCRVLSQRTSYVAYLIFKFEEESYNFDLLTEEASVRVGSHVSKYEVCLQPDEEVAAQRRRTQRYGFTNGDYGHYWFAEDEEEVEETRVVGRAPRRRYDGWMEMELGEFFNGDGDDGDVEMCLMEIKDGRGKQGLIVEGIEVRPK